MDKTFISLLMGVLMDFQHVVFMATKEVMATFMSSQQPKTGQWVDDWIRVQIWCVFVVYIRYEVVCVDKKIESIYSVHTNLRSN